MIESNRNRVMGEIDRLVARKCEAAAIHVEGAAKRKTPVDTGRLRSSVTHDSDETGFVVGTNVHYAPYVELGTRYQRPQPYLKPGLMESVGDLRRIFGE
jgi:HK97 gp10 family phage protein